MRVTQIHLIYITVIILAVVLFFKSCDSKTVPKTVTKTVIQHDTIVVVEIQEVPKIVYVNKYIDKQGEKVIIYVDKPTDSTTIKANQYNTTVKSNNATARLKVTTTGELLDVQGVIDYPEVTKTVTITKAKSGLFIYGLMPINENKTNIEIGLSYNIKNRIMLMGGAQYNEFTKSADLKIGLGIKLF